MTTNEEILAAADRLAETVRSRYNDELYHTNVVYYEPAWRDLEPTVESMRRAIAKYANYNADAATSMHASLEHIFGGSFTNPLSDPAVGYIDDVASYITDWYGTAAEAFRLNFLNPYPQIRQNQIALVRELALYLEAYQALVQDTRAKAVIIADQGVAALNSLGTPLAVRLSALAAVVAVVGAVATAGTGVAVAAAAFALIGGGFSVAADAAGGGESEVILQGGNVREVTSSIYAALNEMWRDKNNVERQLAAALEADIAFVQAEQARAAARELNMLVPYAPRIIDTPAGEVDFRLSTSGG